MLPTSFRAAGVACGIKHAPDTLDLTILSSDTPASAAGVFTQNRVAAAPVQLGRERVPGDKVRAFVVNSGNANACTGEHGLRDADRMTEQVADILGCSKEHVLVCSTGIIGEMLPMDKVLSGIDRAAAELMHDEEGLQRAAQGIMTTDTVPKLATRTIDLDGTTVTMTGIAKGAAMIGPNMATMLAFILTDAEIESAELQEMLRHAVNQSFNCISVEGHTSTSDTVLIMANGAAGAAPKRREVQQQLDSLCAELAQAIVRDAEGASHFISIDVTGMRDRDQAYIVAKTVADSALVKTAIHGADPNWGRIVSAAGYAGVEFEERDVSLRLNGTWIYLEGSPVAFDAERLSESIRDNRDVQIDIAFTLGDASCRFWTSDLTAEYVRLNADYHT